MKIKISLVVAILVLLVLSLTGCAGPRVDTYRHVRSGTDTNGNPYLVDFSHEHREGDKMASALPNVVRAYNGQPEAPAPKVVVVQQPQQVVEPVSYGYRPQLYTEQYPDRFYVPGPSIQFGFGAGLNTYPAYYPPVYVPGYAQRGYWNQTRQNYGLQPRCDQPGRRR